MHSQIIEQIMFRIKVVQSSGNDPSSKAYTYTHIYQTISSVHFIFHLKTIQLDHCHTKRWSKRFFRTICLLLSAKQHTFLVSVKIQTQSQTSIAMIVYHIFFPNTLYSTDLPQSLQVLYVSNISLWQIFFISHNRQFFINIVCSWNHTHTPIYKLSACYMFEW